MSLVEMVMPKMGESVMEATVLTWLKKEGDEIEADESVLEVATDKVDTEVPATHGGILKEILAKEGDVIEVGKPIAIIATGEDEGASTPTNDSVKEKEVLVEEQVSVAEAAPAIATGALPVNGGNGHSTISSPTGRFYSPLVKNIARQESISVEELETVTGTGKEGRVTKKDILAYVETRKDQPITAPVSAPAPAPTVQEPAPAPQVQVSVSAEDEIIQMDRMRKMIADRMVESKRTSPHVTSFVEADVTNIVNWRKKVKDDFLKQEGEKLTFTPIFIEAIIRAIKDFPMINITVDGDKIIRKKAIHMGMAVALPSGNLIVPVIRDADQLNLIGLTKRVNDLAARARENKLTPDELSGGTYTISNVGSFGNWMGTPIIVQPQVAIMAVGAIVKKPAVIETEQGDLIGVRHKMFLSHSYDHRVVDGSLGGMMVRRVADYLEQFDVNRRF